MKRLYHPICHLIHGERLYYIVVSFKQDALNSANYLLEKLEELEIINSSCAHFIFGDMDVIIRAWSDEKSINDFKEYLDSLKLIDSYRFLLIENIFTWYKDKINRKINKLTFSQGIIDEILIGEIDSRFFLVLKNNSKMKYNYKYWIFVEEPYSSNSGFYTKFRDILTKKRKHQNLSGTYNISIYTYLTNAKRGFLIKCSTNNFVMSCDNLSKLVEEVASDNEYKMSTYIARSELKEDNDKINIEKTIHLPIEIRKKEILYNLFKSHDCHRGMFEESSEEMNLSEAFCINLSPLFYEIFQFHSDWSDKIRQARNSFKWVVEKKNSTLVSVLLREYVLLETKLRKILTNIYLDQAASIKGIPGLGKQIQNKFHLEEKVISKILNILEKKFVPSTLTFGDIPHLLNILANRCTTNKDKCDLIKNFSEIVTKIAQDRNSLAHGESSFLFQNDKKNMKWIWEEYTFNFLRYHFFYQKWANILREQTKSYEAEPGA